MLAYVKKQWPRLAACLWSLCLALMWLAMRINWSGVSQFLGAEKNQSFFVMQFPLMVCVFLWLAFAGTAANLLWGRKRRYTVISLCISLLFTAAILAVMQFGARDYLPFTMPHFFRSLAVSGCLIVLCAVLCFPPKGKAVRTALLGLTVLAAVVLGFGISANRITYDPVVYAVEDTYQIVFSTAHNSTAWVQIGGNTYYDTAAGSIRSQSRVHKVTVPQSVLDAAGSYEAFAQTMIYRGPFGGYKGAVYSAQRDFRPVNTADGISYYCISDVHGSFDAAIQTVNQQEKLDFLVLLGDITSMIERESDAQMPNYIAAAVTHGEIPVLYARGNHETKGVYAEELSRYVGSLNGAYYYTFRLGDVSGVVLDLGEDHEDDWWEFYGTAQYDTYRQEQTAFLQRCVEEDVLAGSLHRLAVCHIPVPFVNSRGDQAAFKKTWTNLLNELQIDAFVSGHQHELNIYQPGVIEPETTLTYNPAYKGVEGKTYSGYLTDFGFPGFVVSRCSNRQTGSTQPLGSKAFTGLRMDVSADGGVITAAFTNAAGEMVPVCNIFGTDTPEQIHTWTRE